MTHFNDEATFDTKRPATVIWACRLIAISLIITLSVFVFRLVTHTFHPRFLTPTIIFISAQ
ncbi:MAG: hypothetical protein V4440_14250, partial [Pseudomonadota bacterium]